MKIELESDKKLMMIGSGAIQLSIGILLVCTSIATVLMILTGSAPSWLWAMVLLLLILGSAAIMTATDRQVSLIKEGLSEVTETKVVTGMQVRQDFRTDFVTGICLDTGEHYLAAHPPTKPLDPSRLLGRFYQTVLYLEISDGSHVLLAKQLPVFNLPLSGQLLPKVGMHPLAEQAHKMALFLRIPLRNLTLPDTSDVFGDTRQSEVSPAPTPAPSPQVAADTGQPAEPASQPPLAEEAPKLTAPTISVPATTSPDAPAATPTDTDTPDSTPPDTINPPTSTPVPASSGLPVIQPRTPLTPTEASASPTAPDATNKEVEAALNAQLAALEAESAILGDTDTDDKAPQPPTKTT